MKRSIKLAAIFLAAVPVAVAAENNAEMTSLTLNSATSPASANMLTVTIAGTQAFAIDSYGNVRLPNYVDYAGFDSNLSVYGLSTISKPLYLTSDGAGGSNDDVIIFPHGTGKVGVGTTSPQAKLDVNGFARLALNSSAPAACSEENEGSIALTQKAQVCVCDVTPAWHMLNSSNACDW